MRIPNKIRMFGYDWKVIKLKDGDGGSYNWGKNKTIKIGNKYGHQGDVLFHELIEAVLCHNHFRFYGQEQSMEYQFHFNHTGLCKLANQLHQVFEDNKMLK